MSRPGYISAVDRNTQPISLWRGETLSRVTLPMGSHVVVPPEPQEANNNLRDIARRAVMEPTAHGLLQERFQPDTKLVLVVRGSHEFGYTLQRDIRRYLVEEVLEIAANQGVDDARILVARGTHGRLDDQQLRSMLGNRIVDSFVPHGLLHQHNIDDESFLEDVGLTSGNFPVNRWLSEATCVVVVDLANSAPGDDDPLWGLFGAPVYRSALQNMLPCSRSELAAALSASCNAHYLVALHNGQVLPKPLAFSMKRDFSGIDTLLSQSASALSNLISSRLARGVHRRLAAQPGICAIATGDREGVAEAIAQHRMSQSSVPLDQPYDIVSIGVSPNAATRTGSPIDPILAAHDALSHAAPFVRDGGVIIFHHDFEAEFDPSLHVASADYYAEVLRAQRSAEEATNHLVPHFASDVWYRNLYANTYAFHGLYPLELMDSIHTVQRRVKQVIGVGSNPVVARDFGFRPSSTLNDALELARESLSISDPSFLHVHNPPSVTAL